MKATSVYKTRQKQTRSCLILVWFIFALGLFGGEFPNTCRTYGSHWVEIRVRRSPINHLYPRDAQAPHIRLGIIPGTKTNPHATSKHNSNNKNACMFNNIHRRVCGEWERGSELIYNLVTNPEHMPHRKIPLCHHILLSRRAMSPYEQRGTNRKTSAKQNTNFPIKMSVHCNHSGDKRGIQMTM